MKNDVQGLFLHRKQREKEEQAKKLVLEEQQN